ncbi:MAG: hypothetical protein D3922_02040 [Candidatus Electrothrix sp. AR1]|nr:hypothetical protein [Candidatus Electrothrix sp. AR1]
MNEPAFQHNANNDNCIPLDEASDVLCIAGGKRVNEQLIEFLKFSQGENRILQYLRRGSEFTREGKTLRGNKELLSAAGPFTVLFSASANAYPKKITVCIKRFLVL